MMRKNCNCLYMSSTTIQLEVDMMSKDAKSVAKARTGIGKGTRPSRSQAQVSGHLEEGIQSQFQGRARYAVKQFVGLSTRLGETTCSD